MCVQGHNHTACVRVKPEPTNEYDNRAIAVEVNYDGHWHPVGYIAKELTETVHECQSNKNIVSTEIVFG